MRVQLTAKLVSVMITSIILLMTMDMSNAYAEYYVVYAAPTVVCMTCSTPSAKTGARHNKYHVSKKLKRHYSHRRSCSRACHGSTINVYEWQAVPVSSCARAVVTAAADCYHEHPYVTYNPHPYIEKPCAPCRRAPIVEAYPVPYDPDNATADDRAYYDPDMNWGY